MYISNEKRENLDRSVKLSQVIPLSLVGPDQVQRVPAVDWRSSTDSQGISSKPFIGADPGIVKSTNRNSTENVFSVPKYMSYALILHTRTISCCTVLLPMRRKRDKALPSRRPWCAGVATRCIGLQRVCCPMLLCIYGAALDGRSSPMAQAGQGAGKQAVSGEVRLHIVIWCCGAHLAEPMQLVALRSLDPL